jgi:hypothetical protein
LTRGAPVVASLAMRIPPSVIVMSLVTAVPFGLGVRDALKHGGASVEDAFGDSLDFRARRDREAPERAYEAEMRAAQMEREARAKQRIARLDQLYGAKPAAMGTLLDGIQLGADAGSFQPEHVRQRIANASRDGLISVSYDVDATALNAVNVAITSDYDAGDVCDKLDDKLKAAWGKSTNGVWLDPAAHQRATLDLDSCTLRFDRYLEPSDWAAQLPLAVVGTNAEKFADTLGGSAEIDDDHIAWSLPGLRYGKTPTKLEAFVDKGQITAIKATVDSDYDAMLAVRDAISATLKTQPKQLGEGTAFLVWKRKPEVVLQDFGHGSFSVLVGKVLWEH